MTDRSLPHVALSARAHDRLGSYRTDEERLAHLWAQPSTRVLVISGSRLRPIDGEITWVSPSDAPDGTKVLLGERDGATWFAVIVHPAHAPGAREEWVPLRSVLPWLATVAPEQAPFLFHAIGLAEWHHSTRFCPRCGGRLLSRASGHELRCEACDKPQFPRTDPAVIMAVIHPDDDAMLLGRQVSWPENRWSTLAGFCEPGETLEDAVRREVAEETGVQVGEVSYFGSQPWPFPASLMLGFTAVATSRDIEVDATEIAEARWWTREEFHAASRDGSLQVPRGVSISSSLMQDWLGSEIESGWH